MRKKIFLSLLFILIILLSSITYLSIYGVKTDSFNKFIENKLKKYNSKIILQIDEVYIKLNLHESAVNINTKNASLIAESNPVKIDNIDINLNLIKFLKNENSIENINIKSSNNLIKDVNSFINTINYDLSRYIFYSQILEGFLNFKLDIKFEDFSKDIFSFYISGSVNKAKLNLPDYENVNDINFNFQAQDKIIKISNLKFSFQDINFLSKDLELKKEKSSLYFVKGDIENTKALINPNAIFKFLNIKNDFLSNQKILLQSKNLFSFEVFDNKKIKNLKIESVSNFDEIFFNGKYQNIIFLKKGIIHSKYENKKFTADIDSKFVFTKNLKLVNDYKNNNLKISLNSENYKKIKIKGNISNGKTLLDPKILFNLLELDTKLLSHEKINVETNSQFTFEFNDNKIENYLLNSDINLDKFKFDKNIQDTFYLKNIKTNIIFGKSLLNVELKSNYSFIDKNLNSESNKNIINFKLDRRDKKISNVKLLLQTDNNKINIKEIKKYINLNEIDGYIEDQTINLNSNVIVNGSIDDNFKIKIFDIKSDINFDNLNIKYKSDHIQNYLTNYENSLSIKNPQIFFEYSNDIINLQLDGKYLLNDKEDILYIKFKGNRNKFELYSLINLDNSSLNLKEIQYSKEKNIPSKLEILISKSKNSFNLEKIIFSESKNNISIKNLNVTNNFKIKSVDKIDASFSNDNGIKNNFKIKRNLINYNVTGNQIDGENILENLLKNKNKNKFSRLFYNTNTSINLNIDKIYLEKDEYLKNFLAELDIKNNKLFLAKANAFLEGENKFYYSYRTTISNEKITNIVIDEPKPFINNYKFIKGFEEGKLKLNSMKIGNTSRSNLKINNFKVKEVPVLAKILTLASLQGIADLMTGEGIRFDKFEMDFKTKDNITEIEEMYALGPAISIMMEGYIDKGKTTSLKGTLVPATTINKTIAKIPLIGNILVGSKTGEGVFGVSFKIKGGPNDLKSTVNPIKTLTPRFITRTLENIKGN